MKRFVLVTMIVLGLSAGSASAALYYTLTEAYALTLQDVAYSDTGGLNVMSSDSPTTDNGVYNDYGPMQEEVGFFGSLDDKDGDDYAWVKMGDPGANLSLDLSNYSDYWLPVANDDQDKWEVRLFLTTAGDIPVEHVSNWFELNPVADYDLVWDISGISGLNNVVDIGFYVRGHLIGPGTAGFPSDPDAYHISVVPVPAAAILGLLGLGVAGWRLRRFA
jgi:hypothetical protein